MKNYIFIILIILFSSCGDYLDIVPDNIPTLDHAFNSRVMAERYLFTCYSYLPGIMTAYDPGTVGDEFWSNPQRPSGNTPNIGFDLMYFGNDANNPRLNFWDGSSGGKPLWRAIRDCNIFLENIDKVKDMYDFEKDQWIAEVKFLKAYYHYYLLYLYGPIPIIRENLPISVSPEDVLVFREPVDEVFDYVIELLDEAIPDLPLKTDDIVTDLGRITSPIALSVKAKVLVTAASPLFNGNTDYAMLKDNRGEVMFNQTYDKSKWDKAVTACKTAIDACHDAGIELYEFSSKALDISDSTRLVLQTSQIVTDKWNVETIWGWYAPSDRSFGQSANNIENYTIPIVDRTFFGPIGRLGFCATMKMAEMFYSSNGVPIEEDIEYDYDDRYGLTTVPAEAKYYMQPNRVTAKFHLNREPRFYGSIAVDGGWLFGLGRLKENDQWPIQSRLGEITGQFGVERFIPTSLYIKKLFNFQSTISGTTYYPKTWNFPILRLADLYLLYAEALNEVNDSPPEEIFEYLDPIRERAGLKGVKESWTNFSRFPQQFSNKEGMRKIIQRERTIELAFEMHRFWDIRRWKQAPKIYSEPVKGWNVLGETPEEYYQVVIVGYPKLSFKDVLWPIRQNNIIVNPNLFQNPGW